MFGSLAESIFRCVKITDLEGRILGSVFLLLSEPEDTHNSNESYRIWFSRSTDARKINFLKLIASSTFMGKPQ